LSCIRRAGPWLEGPRQGHPRQRLQPGHQEPSAKQDFEHLPPEKLADDILQKELRIAEIKQEIKELLAKA
jgi:hypothetical protein